MRTQIRNTPGLLKVGYTGGDVQQRVAAQYPTLKPGPPPYRIVAEEAAMRSDGQRLPIAMCIRHCERRVYES